MPSQAPLSKGPAKILLVAPNWVGDAVMSLGLAQALVADPAWQREGLPPSVHVLAPPQTAPVYQASPAVARVWQAPWQRGRLQLSLRWQLAQELRQQQFDAAWVLPNTLKSAFIPWLARIPKRTGYASEGRAWLLSEALPRPPKANKPPMLQWYGALGGYSAKQMPMPALALGADQVHSTCAHFGLSPQAPLLAVAPGADYGPAKRWPAEHFAKVVAGVLQQARVPTMPQTQQTQGQPTVVLLGSAKDHAQCQSIVEHLRFMLTADEQAQVRQLAGLTTLPQAMALIQQAQALVCNDSGPMHLAAALGTPVHAVFGSSSPTHTPPLSPRATVHYLGLACSPCYQRECPLGHTDCLRNIKPETVLQGLQANPDQEHAA